MREFIKKTSHKAGLPPGALIHVGTEKTEKTKISALAIGVGFGSQNIVNNFLSGLILLVERPIKIGDIVEVEGIQGTIEWV